MRLDEVMAPIFEKHEGILEENCARDVEFTDKKLQVVSFVGIA